MEEESKHLPQTPFSDPIQLDQLASGFADHPCLILLCLYSIWGNHLFPPPLHHYLLKDRNQAAFIFEFPELSTACVNESSPKCIHYIEANCTY